MKKLITLMFVLALGLVLSTPMFAQEASKQDTMKENSAQKKAKKGDKDKAGQRWEGIVERSSKDESTLTVRKRGATDVRVIHYDNSTQWVSQEHGSKKANHIDPSEVKDGDRVIVVGNYDDKGKFHANLISKRLTPPAH